MKYKVGDKVRIRKDLVVDDYYDEWLFTSRMKEDIESNDYILTISRAYIAYDGKTLVYRYEKNGCSSKWELTESMIEGLVEKKEIKDMKYKVGDKVRIRKDLIVGERYERLTYYDGMEREAERSGENGFTIVKTWIDSYGRHLYEFDGCVYTYSEEMIEGLVGTDRHKFEECMRKLSSLPSSDTVWNAFNYCVTTEPDEDGYEDKLKIISDFLFTEKKKMTKAEIEKELGYKIEIVEGE